MTSPNFMVIVLQLVKLHGEGGAKFIPPAVLDSKKPGLFRVKGMSNQIGNRPITYTLQPWCASVSPCLHYLWASLHIVHCVQLATHLRNATDFFQFNFNSSISHDVNQCSPCLHCLLGQFKTLCITCYTLTKCH